MVNDDVESLFSYEESVVLHLKNTNSAKSIVEYDESTVCSQIRPKLVRRVLFFGPEKCLKEFKTRVGVAPKRRFWATVFSLRIL